VTIDGLGLVNYVGRLKEVIRRGDPNIDRTRWRVLVPHPAVRDVAVVGVPDDRLRERTAALIVLQPRLQLTLAELSAFLGERQVPRQSPSLVPCHRGRAALDWSAGSTTSRRSARL
jgi:non-ribosomal peptide synthetase component E (peptide arylation enzyme)